MPCGAAGSTLSLAMLTIMRDSESARKTRDEAEVIADRLHSAAIHLLRRLRREDATTGLSAPRLSALSVIVFGGPLTLGELANAEQVRPPTQGPFGVHRRRAGPEHALAFGFHAHQ